MLDKDKLFNLKIKLPMHSFTSEDLLLYIYGETSQQTTAAIKAALQSDWSLQEKFNLLKASIDELDTISFSPDNQSVANIMNYAERAVEETTEA